jgi:hypothetical protein
MTTHMVGLEPMVIKVWWMTELMFGKLNLKKRCLINAIITEATLTVLK